MVAGDLDQGQSVTKTISHNRHNAKCSDLGSSGNLNRQRFEFSARIPKDAPDCQHRGRSARKALRSKELVALPISPSAYLSAHPQMCTPRLEPALRLGPRVSRSAAQAHDVSFRVQLSPLENGVRHVFKPTSSLLLVDVLPKQQLQVS